MAIAFSWRETHPWTDAPALGEAAALFDWCLFVPFLYFLCYRYSPRRALLLRTLALACGGLWLAGKIVPVPAQAILTQLGWVRPIGIAILLLFEAAAIVAILRTLFGAAPDPSELERQGVPPLLAKMMLAEARFWRWLWRLLRGR